MCQYCALSDRKVTALQSELNDERQMYANRNRRVQELKLVVIDRDEYIKELVKENQQLQSLWETV